jgi:hypothetical protein
VNAYHGLVAKIFEKEIHSLLRGKKGKATIKKRSNVFGNSISKFFVVKDL